MSEESKSDENGKKEISKKEWERRLNQIKIPKENMNKLIMNFLCMEGYKGSALEFQKQALLEQGKIRRY